MLKFNNISRAGTVGIFLWKNLTSLNGLEFHLHVSDDDSNMFCKFVEIRWILNKCWNFMIFQRAGTVGIFPWNKLTSLNRLKLHMHVSDDDSNMFCKFDEIRWTLKKCWNFMIFWRAGSVSIFLWKNLTSLNRLKFHMHVSDEDSNMFCKFDESWWTLKKCWNFMIYLGPALSAFFCEKIELLWMGWNFTACFWWWFQYVLQVWWNKVNFDKNGEISYF